ncbi:hypothetical protein ABZ865_32050 [Streptomyces sp. NPDC047085]|uniref:hypothetical protein n=1 Tax=Streptomyces sp. NPDC047085 TaxID=3155140 RepID=UPI003400BCE0
MLAEDWGEREALTSRILQCRGDDTVAAVELIEHEGGSDGGSPLGAGHGLADLVLVPWIACTRCGQALLRAHDREPWGDLSYLARHYIITSPDRGTVLRIFPADAASRAFAALLEECADREPVA